jgi:uncharacterized C2H2 Zn-finger protein
VGNSKGYVTVVDKSCWMARERGKPIEERVKWNTVYQLGVWE